MENILYENNNIGVKLLEEDKIYYISSDQGKTSIHINGKNIPIILQLLKARKSKTEFYIATSKNGEIFPILKNGYLYNCKYFKRYSTYLCIYKSNNEWCLTDYRTGFQIGRSTSTLERSLWNNLEYIDSYINFLENINYKNINTLNILLSNKKEKEYNEEIEQSILRK